MEAPTRQEYQAARKSGNSGLRHGRPQLIATELDQAPPESSESANRDFREI